MPDDAKSLRKVIKDELRTTKKANEDYGGDFSRVLDMDGAMISFSSIQEAKIAWEKALIFFGKEKDGEDNRVIRDKDFELKSGYHDYKINLRMSNGSSAEIQFLDKYIKTVKDKVCHVFIKQEEKFML